MHMASKWYYCMYVLKWQLYYTILLLIFDGNMQPLFSTMLFMDKRNAHMTIIMNYCTFGHGFSKDQNVQFCRSYHSKPGMMSSSSKTWHIPVSFISFTPMQFSVLVQKVAQERGKISRRLTACIFVDNACVFSYWQASQEAGQSATSCLCR